MKRLHCVLGFLFVVMGLADCGGKYPSPELEPLTRGYWNAVFTGDYQAAYQMLAAESRSSKNIEIFIQEMNFLVVGGEISPELQGAFAHRARISIIGMEAKGKQATVHLILLLPDMASLQEALWPQMPEDADESWMIEQMMIALEENAVATRELRVQMTWLLEDKQWRLLLG